MSGLIGASMLLTASRVVGIGLQALIILFLAHSLSIESMGYFGVVYAVLGIARFLGPLGTDQIALRRIAQGTKADIGSVSSASLAVTGLVGGLGAAVAFGGLAVGLAGSLSIMESAAAALAVPAFALSGSFVGQIRGLGHNLSAQMPEAVGVHLLFGLLLILLSLSGRLDLGGVLACLSLAAWSVTLIYAAMRRRFDRRSLRRPTYGQVAEAVREGARMFQALALTALSLRAPIFLASVLLGPGATAILEIANRFGRVTEIVTSSVGLTISPHFARLASSRDRHALLVALRHGAAMAAIPAWVWLAAVVFGGSSAITFLLPPSYADAYVPAVLVAAAVTINATLGLASTLLLMSGDERIVRQYSLAQLAAIVVGSLILAPMWGVAGVAAAMVFGTLVRDGGLMAHVLVARAPESGPKL